MVLEEPVVKMLLWGCSIFSPDHSAPALFPQLLSCLLSLLGPCIQELQDYTSDILTISNHICLHGNNNDNNKNPTKWGNLVNHPPDLCLAGVIQTHGCILGNLCSVLVFFLGALALTFSPHLSIPPSLPYFLLTLAW